MQQKTEAAASEGVKGDFDCATASVAGWNLTVEDVEVNASLENVSVEVWVTQVWRPVTTRRTADDGQDLLPYQNEDREGRKQREH